MSADSRDPVPLILTALRRILRPLVRLMIHYGIVFPALIEELKRIFIDVAEKEFRSGKPENTDSRISLLTGVHRKDIRRLRGHSIEKESIPKVVSLGTQVATHWLSNPQTMDSNGAPLPLTRAQFDAMVMSINVDVRPRTLLDDWISLGIASIRPTGEVILHRESLFPKQDMTGKTWYFGRNVANHIEAAVWNLMHEDGSAKFERSLHYDGLSPESVRMLSREAEDLAMSMLLELNRRAEELAQEDAGRANATGRINIGTYIWFDADKPEAAE